MRTLRTTAFASDGAKRGIEKKVTQMSWESRGDSGRYYTRSHKRDGRITREYIGRGELAELIAQRDVLKRQQRRAELAQRRKQRAADERLDAALGEFCRLAEAAAHAELLAAGNHPHRGEWRKRRGR